MRGASSHIYNDTHTHTPTPIYTIQVYPYTCSVQYSWRMYIVHTVMVFLNMTDFSVSISICRLLRWKKTLETKSENFSLSFRK